MHIRRGFLGWGVFLILAGAVPLLVRSGYLTSDQIGHLWQLWPLIIIGIGVGLILSRTRFDFVGGLIVAATFGLMLGGVLSLGSIPLTRGVCGQQAGSVAFPSRDGTFAGSGGIELRLDCGNMHVSVAPGNTWHLDGTDADGHGPDVTSSDSKLTVHSPDHGGAAFWAFGPRDLWNVKVPDASTIDLDLQLNAGEATVDLAGASLAGVDVELNAGSATVDMGSAKAIKTLDTTLNAGSSGLTLPNLSLTGSHPGECGLDPAVRAAERSAQAAHGREHRRELRLRRSRPGEGLDRPGRRRASRARPSRSNSRPPPTRARSRWTRRTAVTDRLYRSRDDRMLAGVAAGVAEMLDADPSIIRIAWVLLAFLTGGIALVVYIVMAIVVPERPVGMPTGIMSPPGAPSTEPVPEGSWMAPDGSTVPMAGQAPAVHQRDPAGGARAGVIVGLILVVIGGLFLARQFLPTLDFGLWWPIVAIILGIVLIAAALAPSRRSG